VADLNTYLKDAQRLLREQNQSDLNPEDLISFINRARREIAMRSQCIRILTPISGAVTGASIVASGTGYPGGATLAITSPDFPSGVAPKPNGDQATGVLFTSGGSLSSVNIVYGGAGYFMPQASVVASSGAGASVTLQVQPLNLLTQGQEVYPFSGVDLTGNPGVQSVYCVMGVSIIYANYRYSLPVYPFSAYQAYIRQYPFQYQYVPTFASQYGQGANGSFYVFPLPSQTYQYELDCLCIPQDLTAALSFEALPDPWTDAVAYLACAHGMMSIQNYNIANFYKSWYDEFAQRYSNYARPGRATNPYGRYFWLGWLIPLFDLLWKIPHGIS
jgi:hypothetical protein